MSSTSSGAASIVTDGTLSFPLSSSVSVEHTHEHAVTLRSSSPNCISTSQAKVPTNTSTQPTPTPATPPLSIAIGVLSTALIPQKASNELIASSSSSSAFPPNLKKRKAHTVLSEADYTHAVERIIKRDFFPNLLRAASPPPYSSHTNADGSVRSSSASTASASRRVYSKDDLSLNVFHARFTSEDNESFSDLQDKAAATFAARKGVWLSDSAEAHANRLVSAARHGQASYMHSHPYTVKNSLMFLPPALPDSKAEQIRLIENDLSDRMIETETQQEMDEEGFKIPHKKKQKIPEWIEKKEKKILHENTRFDNKINAEDIHTLLEVKNDSQEKQQFPLLRTPIPPFAHLSSSTQSSLSSSSSSSSSSSLSSSSTAAFVPQLTWGTLLATPIHLSAEDSDAQQPASARGFRVPKTPSREQLAWNLNEKSRKEKDEQKKRKEIDRTPLAAHAQNSSTPANTLAASTHKSRPPLSLQESLSELSPAAHRLLKQRIGKGNSSTANILAVDGQLRASYTPSHSSNMPQSQSRTTQEKSHPPRVMSLTSTTAPATPGAWTPVAAFER